MATDADNLQFDQLYDQWIHDPLEALTISAEGQSTGGSVGALPLPVQYHPQPFFPAKFED
jgi:hypothetical protein